MVFFLVVNVKMRTIFAFEHLLAEKKLVLNCFEHENFITSGPDLLDFRLYCFALCSALIALFLIWCFKWGVEIKLEMVSN